MPIDISLVSSNVVITEVSGHKKGWKPMSASYEFDANNNLLLTINGQTRSIGLSNLTVSGVAPADANAAITALAAVFLNAGVALSTFTALSGSTWDGSNAYITLTGATSITLTPATGRVSGVLHVTQDATGSRTLTINNNSIAINSAANSLTAVGWYMANGHIFITVDTTVTSGDVISYDPDAATFFAASGITSSTQKNAVNQLVLDLKAASLWTNMKAVYPVVGGSAAAHKYNLRNAADTDAAFRLSFIGTITHNANGVTGDGTTGYADTFLNDNTHITGNPITIGSYSRTNGNTGFSMGANGSGGTYIADRNSIILRTHDTSDTTIAVANQQRLIVGTRQSSGVQNMYKDGTQLSNNSPAVAGKVNFKYYLMAMCSSGTATGFSDKNYCFFFIYDGGMTQTEVTALTNAVNTYQTALGRNV